MWSCENLLRILDNYVTYLNIYNEIWNKMASTCTEHQFLRTGGGPPGVMFYKRFFFLIFFSCFFKVYF